MFKKYYVNIYHNVKKLCTTLSITIHFSKKCKKENNRKRIMCKEIQIDTYLNNIEIVDLHIFT